VRCLLSSVCQRDPLSREGPGQLLDPRVVDRVYVGACQDRYLRAGRGDARVQRVTEREQLGRDLDDLGIEPRCDRERFVGRTAVHYDNLIWRTRLPYGAR
jgi:hypothetical protein